jgi:hypothetical protein
MPDLPLQAFSQEATWCCFSSDTPGAAAVLVGERYLKGLDGYGSYDQ